MTSSQPWRSRACRRKRSRAAHLAGDRRQAQVEDENGGFEASEEELQEAYDQAKSQQEQMAQQPQQGQQAQQPQEMPPFEDMKPQLEDQVTQQKQAEATDALATELREGADVTTNL